MGIQLTLAVRYLAGRKLRAILTTLAVIFGVLVLFGMNIIVPTMLQAVQSTMMAASDQVDMTATLKSGDAFPTSTIDKVQAVSGVRAVQGVLQRPINLPADFFDHNPAVPDKVSVISLIGIDPARARSVRPYPLRAGRFLEAGGRRGGHHLRQPCAVARAFTGRHAFAADDPGTRAAHRS